MGTVSKTTEPQYQKILHIHSLGKDAGVKSTTFCDQLLRHLKKMLVLQTIWFADNTSFHINEAHYVQQNMYEWATETLHVTKETQLLPPFHAMSHVVFVF